MYLGDFLEDATVHFAFSSHSAAGGREDFSGSLEEADIVISKNGSAMTLDASTITITHAPGSRTGLTVVTVDMSNDADFTTGADYIAVLFPDTETVASVAPVAVLAHWSCQNRPVPWNAAWDAEVQSECADALTAYDPPTKAELDSGLAALNDLDAAGIRSAVGLASANLDTQLAALPTAGENADAVWDEPYAAHISAGTFGEAIVQIGSDTTALLSSLTTIDNYLDTEIAAILADTNELQTDWANGGRLDLLIDAIKAKTDSQTYTVAGVLDVNLQYVNDVEVIGVGTSGNKWRAA